MQQQAYRHQMPQKATIPYLARSRQQAVDLAPILATQERLRGVLAVQAAVAGLGQVARQQAAQATLHQQVHRKAIMAAETVGILVRRMARVGEVEPVQLELMRQVIL